MQARNLAGETPEALVQHRLMDLRRRTAEAALEKAGSVWGEGSDNEGYFGGGGGGYGNGSNNPALWGDPEDNSEAAAAEARYHRFGSQSDRFGAGPWGADDAWRDDVAAQMKNRMRRDEESHRAAVFGAKREEEADKRRRWEEERKIREEEARKVLEAEQAKDKAWRAAIKEQVQKKKTVQKQEDYDERWRRFAKSCDMGITMADVPFPVVGGGEEELKHVILHGVPKEQHRRRMREEVVRWHPDKFMQKWGLRLHDKHRSNIEKRVKELSQAVNNIYASLNRNSPRRIPSPSVASHHHAMVQKVARKWPALPRPVSHPMSRGPSHKDQSGLGVVFVLALYQARHHALVQSLMSRGPAKEAHAKKLHRDIWASVAGDSQAGDFRGRCFSGEVVSRQPWGFPHSHCANQRRPLAAAAAATANQADPHSSPPLPALTPPSPVRTPLSPQEDFLTSIGRINAALSLLQLELRAAADQADGGLWYGVVNRAADSQGKLGTTYSHEEIQYFKCLVEHVVTASNGSGCISSVAALHLTPAPSSTQLQQYLKSIDGVVVCDVCHDAVVKAVCCASPCCEYRLHQYCLPAKFHRVKNPKCPQCDTPWPSSGGEPAPPSQSQAAGQGGADRRRRAGKRTVGEEAREEQREEEREEEEDRGDGERG
ncbi:unnamed protein product [Closterium sp. Yama58-4]|nr:unnamed protein product [Closterium sp. Yama58-4]